MADSGAPKSYSSDPSLYLYTSLTSGSSHIVTATSRLETILKANRIPFIALDIATDEKARMIWGRRAGKDETGRVRKIPGLVQMGEVLGDLVEIEEWNEYGEMKQHVKIVGTSNLVAPAKSMMAKPKPSASASKPPPAPEPKKPQATPPSTAAKAPEPAKAPATEEKPSIVSAIRQAGAEAAQKALDDKKKVAATVSGVVKAEPAKEVEKTEKAPEKAEKSPEKATQKPLMPPLLSVTDLPLEKLSLEEVTTMQSPTSTAWREAQDLSLNNLDNITMPVSLNAKLESMQSPNSTTWKPKVVNPPVLVHRGSSISTASAEEIKSIEEKTAIKEEEEDDEDNDEEESEEDSDEEEDDDDDYDDEKKDSAKDTKKA
ncbi:hypothetical protein HYALB_00002279 [Hymenoscyphus albidus]|uniref:Uncharacterized protein n=1 Tax=Hymenoscyphus albidus TaxID=595503 RepID=A0A9N9QBV9_9HELO|nr:hypothetical protein HYALB_00002279 [Hymenoscyphus albidus]